MRRCVILVLSATLAAACASEKPTAVTPPAGATFEPSSLSQGWRRVPHEESTFGGLETQIMWSVAAWSGGLAAVGFDYAGDDSDAAAWISEDGANWTRAPHDETIFGGDGDQGMTAVTAWNNGLVAVGSDASFGGQLEEIWGHSKGLYFGSLELLPGDSAAAVWTSADGITWDRLAHDEAVFGGNGYQTMAWITAWSGGLAAVGTSGTDAAVWVSADGVSWERIPDNEETLGGPGTQIMTSAAAWDEGLIAVGTEMSDITAHAAVWTSRDGVSWTRVPHDTATFGGSGDPVGMTSVAAQDDRLIAVGWTIDGYYVYPTVWTSPDGALWTQVTRDEAVFGSEEVRFAMSVTAWSEGLAVVGWEDLSAEMNVVVWTSADGSTWSRVPHDPEVFGLRGMQQACSIAAWDGGVVAVGAYREYAEDYDAAVWYWTPD
jgi:hypothetical protein